MANYAPDHAGALADLQDAGTAVTFTRTATGYDEDGGGASPTDSTVTGYAIRTRGNPLRYQALGLVEAVAPTLLFVPNTFGQTPEPGDVVSWGSVDHTVREVQPLEPDGNAILSKVVVSR